MDEIQKQKIELAVAEREFEAKEFLGNFGKFQRYLLVAMLVLLIPIYFIAEYSVSGIYMNNFSKTQIKAHDAVFGETLPVKVVEQRTIFVKDNNYSSYALVKNPNKELSATDIPWTLRIYDGTGKQIYVASDTFFVLPGDQKYLIIPNVKLSSVPASTQVEIGDTKWVRRINIPNIILTQNLRTYGDQNFPTGYSLAGGFTNQSSYTLGKVTVKGVLFDSSGKVIAVSQTFASTLQPKETRDFTMFWPISLGSQINGRPQIFVETNPLDPGNLNQ